MANNPQDEFTLVSKPEDEFTLVSAPADISQQAPKEATTPSMWDVMTFGPKALGLMPTARQAVTGTRLALETVPVAAAQLAAGPAGGAVVGGFTNLLGQGLENLVFDKKFDPVENAAAAAYGGIPLAGEIARAKGILGTAMAAGSEAARMGGATALIEAPRMAYEEGRVPTVGELAPRVGMGAAAGFLGGALQQRGQGQLEEARKAANFLDVYREAGVVPTPGMVMPEKLGAMEQRMMQRGPVTSPAGAMEEAVYRDLKAGLDDIVRAPQQKAEVYQAYANQIEGARELAKDTLEKQMTSILDEAKGAAVANNVRSGKPMDDVAARNVMVDVTKKVKNAYDQHWAKLYGMFDNESAIYDTTQIYQRIEQAFNDAGIKEVPSQISNLLKTGKKFAASRNALSNVQSLLSQRGQIGEVNIGGLERTFAEASHDVTGLINKEVDRIYPTEIADQLKAINQDYRGYLDLFRSPGVQAVFTSDATGNVAKSLTNNVIQNGVKAGQYAEIQEFIKSLRTPQAARNVGEIEGHKVLGGPIPAINFELADSLERHVNSLVRDNIIHSASDGKVNPKALLGKLKQLSNDPEALAKFGFGDKNTLNELETLVADYPDASKLSTEQWGKLFSSPAFKDAIAKGTGISSVIQPALSGTSAKNNMTRALFFRSAGDLENADKYLRAAKDDAASLGINFEATQKKYDELAKLPDYTFFNKPGGLAPADYKTLIDGISDTAANKVTNDWVKELKATLQSNAIRGGSDLLKGLQRGYIQDHLVQLESAPKWSQSPTRMNIDNLAEFLAPNSKKGAEEMARAKALLDEDQIKALQKSLEAASALRYYRRATGEVKGSATGSLSDRGIVLRGWDAVGDMILKGEWNRVADAIANPSKFEKRLYVAGQEVKALGEAAEKAIPTLQRFLPQQQQVPQNIQQFAQPQPTR